MSDTIAGRSTPGSILSTKWAVAIRAPVLPALTQACASFDFTKSIARRIEESFSRPFELPGDIRISLSASVGVALAPAGADPKLLLRHADAAMYQAKDRGRACYQLYRDVREDGMETGTR